MRVGLCIYPTLKCVGVVFVPIKHDTNRVHSLWRSFSVSLSVSVSVSSIVKRAAVLAFGPVAVPRVEIEPAFLRESARAVLEAVQEAEEDEKEDEEKEEAERGRRRGRRGHVTHVCLLGGLSALSHLEGAMEEGFSLVQMARTLIREPDFLLRIEDEAFGGETFEAFNSGDCDGGGGGGDGGEIDGCGGGGDTVAYGSLDHRRVVGDVGDVEGKCISCNLCVIATVDPKAPFGCPFRRIDEKLGSTTTMMRQQRQQQQQQQQEKERQEQQQDREITTGRESSGDGGSVVDIEDIGNGRIRVRFQPIKPARL